MASIPSITPAALLSLRQASMLTVSTDTTGGTPQAGSDLIATANGASNPRISGAGNRSAQAQAKVTEALFDPNTVDIHQMKIDLMQRLGDAFGVSLDDFSSQASFGSAIEEIIGQLKLLKEGPQILSEIEKKLGLDKLGISLDTLVGAIIDPEGGDGERLDAAMKKQLADTDKGDEQDAAEALRALSQPDEMGLYGSRGA